MSGFDDILSVFEGETVPEYKPKEFKKATPGTELGILYSIVDCGTHAGTNTDGSPWQSRNLRFKFELPGQTDVYDGKESPLSVTDFNVKWEINTKRTLSANQAKGTSRPTLWGYAVALLGLTPERKDEFNLGAMVGKACQLVLVEDGDFVKVANAVPLMRGFTPPAMVNAPSVYSVPFHGFDSDAFAKLSRGEREKLTNSLEFAAWEADGHQSEARKIRESCKKQD